MYEKFEKIINKHGITSYKVSKDTGVSQVTLSDWKHGKYTPKIDKIKKIANYLGVKVEELLD